jgi:hypothetical protein
MLRFFVPDVLPMAPRPHQDELLSSWLHRIAAANWLSLPELIDSVRYHGDCLPDLQCGDYRMPAAWRSRLAALCRVPSVQLWSLELQCRFPGIDPDWFTYERNPRFRAAAWPFGASLPFCASCCQQQHSTGFVYVCAEWCFVFRTHCPLHFTPLIDHCQSCGNIALPRGQRACSAAAPAAKPLNPLISSPSRQASNSSSRSNRPFAAASKGNPQTDFGWALWNRQHSFA